MKEVILTEPVQAHRAISALYRDDIKSQTMAGQRLKLTLQSAEDERTLKQNKFYWGPCLKDISEQASVGGAKYSKDAWHELFKRQFLPRKVKKCHVAGKARPVVSVSLGSTTDLSVRRMSKYLDELQAYASTELGVSFTVANWESYEDRR